MQFGRVGVVASALAQDSDGFRYADPVTGTNVLRGLSDYKRFNLSGKVIYNPSDTSEIMVNADTYHSSYGIPAALTGSARYWRFKDWDRTSVSAGGYTELGENAVLRFRGYYVNYYNVLDQYTDSTLSALSAVSSYNNPIYGFFGLGEFTLAKWNTLKASLYFEGDRTRQQDNPGLDWYGYHQQSLSGAVEDHIAIFSKWQLIAGVSLDALHKYVGGTTTRLNPLVGLKYTPTDALDIHISFATKSKYPSMRELYSSVGGNPDLKSESGRSSELAVTYNKEFFLSASFFLNSLRDFIISIRLPDGTREFLNINQARINGFEFQAQKKLTLGAFGVEAQANYTFLDHKDISDDRPLDALAKHTGTFDLGFSFPGGPRLGLTGIVASKSWYWNTSTSTDLIIPSYFSLDAVLSWSVRNFEPFFRVTNLFNHYFYTEPGFPWRGRTIEFGLKAGLF